jgi:Mg/Co/Ni transporter MgtE
VQADWDTCFVVNEENVVLGRLGRNVLLSGTTQSVEEAMTPGPRTIRPSARLEAMIERMRGENLTGLPVTLSDGRLVGVLLLEDAERARVEDSRGEQP